MLRLESVTREREEDRERESYNETTIFVFQIVQSMINQQKNVYFSFLQLN